MPAFHVYSRISLPVSGSFSFYSFSWRCVVSLSWVLLLGCFGFVLDGLALSSLWKQAGLKLAVVLLPQSFWVLRLQASATMPSLLCVYIIIIISFIVYNFLYVWYKLLLMLCLLFTCPFLSVSFIFYYYPFHVAFPWWFIDCVSLLLSSVYQCCIVLVTAPMYRAFRLFLLIFWDSLM